MNYSTVVILDVDGLKELARWKKSNRPNRANSDRALKQAWAANKKKWVDRKNLSKDKS